MDAHNALVETMTKVIGNQQMIVGNQKTIVENQNIIISYLKQLTSDER
jgi:hypothetical protein